jgi:hypothetical protein
VELSGVIVAVLLLLGPLIVATAGEYLRSLYRLHIRQYERILADAYSTNFRARATEARTLDMNVGYALRRAKQTVDDARRNSTDISHAQSVLNQVSDLLNTAAETSDRALRSLESQPHQAIRSRPEIFTSDDLHDS